MEEKDLLGMMDDLADTEVHLDLIVSERETLKKTIIPNEVQAELESVDFEFADRIQAIEENIKTRREQLQFVLKEYAKPIKSKYYSWSYKDPKPEWNIDALDGYALDHPEILWMRKDGTKPTTKLTPLKR